MTMETELLAAAPIRFLQAWWVILPGVIKAISCYRIEIKKMLGYFGMDIHFKNGVQVHFKTWVNAVCTFCRNTDSITNIYKCHK